MSALSLMKYDPVHLYINTTHKQAVNRSEISPHQFPLFLLSNTTTQVPICPYIQFPDLIISSSPHTLLLWLLQIKKNNGKGEQKSGCLVVLDGNMIKQEKKAGTKAGLMYYHVGPSCRNKKKQRSSHPCGCIKLSFSAEIITRLNPLQLFIYAWLNTQLAQSFPSASPRADR
ncbi:hypothetical protein XELAEV_18019011mg [Xenopus laevis]|uniref:Uncharacterized protein n=1 Tax=Xenopus laevis TaxID=8355 RepID=A0A974DE49_XENLA|nr:hypothetical protein XELAEV_18019011mg [Xenopus laevis]